MCGESFGDLWGWDGGGVHPLGVHVVVVVTAARRGRVAAAVGRGRVVREGGLGAAAQGHPRLPFALNSEPPVELFREGQEEPLHGSDPVHDGETLFAVPRPAPLSVGSRVLAYGPRALCLSCNARCATDVGSRPGGPCEGAGCDGVVALCFTEAVFVSGDRIAEIQRGVLRVEALRTTAEAETRLIRIG